MATVYLSSTRDDLLTERDAVTRWLEKARHTVLHSYRASPDPVVQACIADVESADVYLLLSGHRYGSRPPLDNPDQLSITELEFRAARASAKPTIALFQSNPPEKFSDFVNGDDATRARLRAFRSAVEAAVTPDRFGNAEELISALSSGVTEAVRKLEDKRREDAPSITPGVNRPHPRLLSKALLLVHAAGTDDTAARDLAAALGGLQLRVERHAVDPENGIDWPAFDRALAECRGLLLLLTPAAAARCAAAGPSLLPQLLAFGQAQTGCTAAATIGSVDTAALQPLRRAFALDDWAKTPAAITPDLAQLVADLRSLHPDIDDPRLVGLQCMVVAMTAAEAQALDATPALLDALGAEQRSWFTDMTKSMAAAGVPWTSRYGARREDWQPFGAAAFADPARASAIALLRDVVQQINRLTVVPRRDQDALLGHRIRLRPYALDPLLDADDPAARELVEQMQQRRCLLLVDEISLAHPRIRSAAGELLAGSHATVATIAPFDPPSQTIDAALKRDNGLLQLGSLIPRFRTALDPQCELTLASLARLRRWLRVNVPETLAMFSSAALDDRRALIRSQAGL